MTTTPTACLAICTEDGVDQITYDRAIANREARDLRAMGCTVKIREFPSEADAYAWHDKRRGH